MCKFMLTLSQPRLDLSQSDGIPARDSTGGPPQMRTDQRTTCHGAPGTGRRVGHGALPLYTPEQRLRRDGTVWTLVQGILAPVQMLVCAISAVLVLRFLWAGDGYLTATASILIKTLLLYAIMVTGAVWEKVVFGQYLFAPAFFWEDVVSFGVIALHTAYLWALFTGGLGAQGQMVLALVAYAAYGLNAAQFIWKLRMARRDTAPVAGVLA